MSRVFYLGNKKAGAVGAGLFVFTTQPPSPPAHDPIPTGQAKFHTTESWEQVFLKQRNNRFSIQYFARVNLQNATTSCNDHCPW